MARRPSLGSMLDQVKPIADAPATPANSKDAELTAPAPTSPAPTSPVDEAPIASTGEEGAQAAVTPVARTRPTTAAPARETSDDVPRYLTMVRKEARITENQSEALTILTRRLNRARGGAGERLTDNTLIRVALDLLLDRRDELRGISEDDLRKSLGL